LECISVLPGRIRFKSLTIYDNGKLARYIERYIHSLFGVKFSRVTEKTGSILVVYHADKTNPEVLKENIENALAAAKMDNSRKIKVFDQYMEAMDKKARAGRKLVFWGLLYLIFKIKGFRFGKFSISSNLNVLKAASVVTIIGGYPIIKKVYKKLTKHIPADSDLILELTALSFTIIRESSKGILVLMLKALDDYIKFYTESLNRRAMLDSYERNFKMAWIKTEEGEDILISVDSLQIGDSIYVNPGEVVPVCGVVEDGYGIVNNLYYTGQPIISRLSKGSEVEEGIAVVQGSLRIKVCQLPEILEKEDITTENLRFYNKTRKYQEIITNAAFGTAALSYLYTGNILNAFSVMLVLSPKAVLAALNSGISNYLYLLKKYNIYLQNPNTFENIKNVDKIIFDKTGTLTYGRMRFLDSASFDSDYPKETIARLYAIYEEGNSHSNSLPIQSRTEDSRTTAEGSKGRQGREILIGSEDLMKENKIDYSFGIDLYRSYLDSVLTPAYVAVGGKLVGLILLNDIVRNGAKELIHKLQYEVTRDISLLTGDMKARARDIAGQLGIEKVYSEMDYFEKAKVIETERRNGVVMMVGDGFNDILAMRTAHASVSFAGNSYDKAKLNSDCIIYHDNMLRLADLILLTRKSYGAIKRTMVFSGVYNIVLGALAFNGRLNLFSAKSLNTLNSLIVLLLNKRILLLKSGNMQRTVQDREHRLYQKEKQDLAR